MYGKGWTISMNLLQGKIKHIYFNYLAAAFGSALIVSIYSLVDCAMVGQYEGPTGVAALATVMPVWNIIFGFGLLFGIGGAVLMSTSKGKGEGLRANQWFTSALIGGAILSVVILFLFVFFSSPLLRLFGADENLLPLAEGYLAFIKPVIPLFLLGQLATAFLRNDNAPGKATVAVICGGIFNVAGDWFFVFVCDMGIRGAGLATALGQCITFCILLSHFFSAKCTLRLVRPAALCRDLCRIFTTGFSTFFVDIAVGVLSMLMNNQIMRYEGTSALAVYGVIINVNMLVQACAYGIGQAAQPIMSVNFGAGQYKRVRETLYLSLFTVAVMSLAWTAITMGFPAQLTGLFMSPTPEVLVIAPAIMRCYFSSFLLLPLTIFSTYYFQSILKPGASFLVSVSRGLVISGILIFLLPAVWGGRALWLAMPITELIVAVMVCFFIRKYNRMAA